MQDEFFEWDDAKAAINWRSHCVAFPYAVKAFRDLFAIEWVDNREGYPLRQNSCRLKFLKKIKFEIRDENVYKVF